jgi:mono/diheme cytochrome c family protein
LNKKLIFFVFLIVFTLIIIFVIYFIKKPTYSAVYRGRLIAFKYGCFNCHGFEGIGGIKNPGYKYDEIPPWQADVQMMYIKDTSEIKEWILYSKPLNREINNKGLIKMPRYKGIIKDDELKDLLVYLKVLMGFINIDDSIAMKGYLIAKNLGCFGCHGDYGLGGMPNPNSLKGYIPGWDDEHFDKLVKNDDELREWILKGKINRLKFINFVMERQVIKMPAYEGYITEDELNALIYYIKWIRDKVKSLY